MTWNWPLLLGFALLVLLRVWAEAWLRRQPSPPLGRVLAVLGGGTLALALGLAALGGRWPGLLPAVPVLSVLGGFSLSWLLGRAAGVRQLPLLGRVGLYALAAVWPGAALTLWAALLTPAFGAELGAALARTQALALGSGLFVLVWEGSGALLQLLRGRWVLPGPGERSSPDR
ncbi:hypothetical protein [Deinococcus murrayi]|uniref:hypothetical protein n=1 Tax=Deinococcus murrayi TaxID=68910 RepID=UPI0004851F7F|nr:hypothetical protein [Deinococcus murrayi]